MNTETALSKNGKFTQEDVPKLLKLIVNQIKKLKGDMPEAAKTTGDLSGFGKIKDIKSVELLIKAHSSVVNRAKAYRESAKTLLEGSGVKTPQFLINGSSEEAWCEDIQSRILIVANKTKLDKLVKAKALMEERLSEDDKLSKSVGDVFNMLEIE